MTPGEAGLAWDPFRLKTKDGLWLTGWLVRHPRPRGILLLFHGYGTCKADLLDLAQAFHENGSYHLLLPDFRGHGESEGWTISFGLRDVSDIQEIISQLAGDPEFTGLPIGCYGISMGGAIGLLAAARSPQIRAVVADSAYADLAKAIARIQWISYYIPRFPLGQMVIWGTQLRLACRLQTLSPVYCIGRIAPHGVLIIHGMKDQAILPSHAEALYQAAGEPKELWLVPEAEHVASFYRNQKDYLHRVLGFFENAFQGTS